MHGLHRHLISHVERRSVGFGDMFYNSTAVTNYILVAISVKMMKNKKNSLAT